MLGELPFRAMEFDAKRSLRARRRAVAVVVAHFSAGPIGVAKRVPTKLIVRVTGIPPALETLTSIREALHKPVDACIVRRA